METCIEVGGIEVEHTLEFASRIVEHSGAVEGHAEVAAFNDFRVTPAVHLRLDDLLFNAMRKAGLDQTIQRPPDVEFVDADFVRDFLDAARAVEHCSDLQLFGLEIDFGASETFMVYLEDE